MPKTSVIYVLLHSFQYFQYYPEIQKENRKYTVVTYPEIERDYYEFLKNFEMQPAPEILDITLIVKDELREFCTAVEQSTIFELILPQQKESKLRPLRLSSIAPSSWSTVVQLVPVMLGGEEKLIPMFHCKMGEHSDDQFYLAYGFNEGYAFVFKDSNSELGPRVYGLVEPTPDIDPKYYNQRRLEKYFLQIHRTHDAKSREFDPLCSLNGYQQFRLCSVLENSRRLQDLKRKNSEDKKINTERRHQRRCEEKLRVTFEKLDFTSPAYSSLDVEITAMPCHLEHKEDRTQLSFLVSSNPEKEHSVFILDRRVNLANGKKEGRVVQHVSNIAVLKYADSLY